METIVQSLKDITPWCLEANIGDEKDFVIPSEVSQDEASKFAFDINQKREGCVWVGVETALAPEPTTKIHVRCSN